MEWGKSQPPGREMGGRSLPARQVVRKSRVDQAAQAAALDVPRLERELALARRGPLRTLRPQDFLQKWVLFARKGKVHDFEQHWAFPAPREFLLSFR